MQIGLGAVIDRSRALHRSLRRGLRREVVWRYAWRNNFFFLDSAPYRPGLFSEVAVVLGLLELYERRPQPFAGLRVDFGEEGLYFDPAAGPNWWEYYFEPLRVGLVEGASEIRVPIDDRIHFAYRAERRIPREKAHRLLSAHLRVKPRLLEAADAYAREVFNGAHVIGIHYRGTDKDGEAPRVPYEAVEAAVRRAMAQARAARTRLFLATDEQAFVDFLAQRFPGQLFYREHFRSVDGAPIHERDGDNRRKGEDAVLDCLLLARCTQMVRTASNLSLFASFFNPALPEVQLNREY